MNNKLISLATSLALLAVVFGAFGAHSLKEVLEPHQIDAFETASRYQFYHALALLILGLHADSLKSAVFVGKLMAVGVFCFSFSIYLLSLQDYLGVNLSFLGPVTPIGGLLLIISWSLLLLKNFKKHKLNF